MVLHHRSSSTLDYDFMTDRDCQAAVRKMKLRQSTQASYCIKWLICKCLPTVFTMNYYKSVKQHIAEVTNGDIMPDILAYSIKDVSSKIYAWYNEEDFKRLTGKDKAIHFLLVGLTCFLWMSVCHGLMAGPKDSPLTQFCGSISIAVGGIMTAFRLIDNFRTRSKLSALTRELNARVAAVKMEIVARGSPLLQVWNQHYLILVLLLIFSVLLLGGLLIMILLYAIITGSTFLQLSLPFERASYSALWWCELIFQLGVVAFCAYVFPITETISIDCIFQLTFLYRARYEDIPMLLNSTSRGSPESRLIAICKELKLYHQLTTDFLEIIRRTTYVLWSTGFLILGMATVCFAVEMSKGLLSAISVLFYPVYVLIMLGTWCVVSSYFQDNVASLNWNLYNCDWIDSSLEFRKLMLRVMIFGQRTPIIQAKPVFVINRSTFATLVKNTYTLYTLLRDIYL